MLEYDETSVLEANARLPAKLPGTIWEADVTNAAFAEAFRRQFRMSLKLALEYDLVTLVEHAPGPLRPRDIRDGQFAPDL